MPVRKDPLGDRVTRELMRKRLAGLAKSGGFLATIGVLKATVELLPEAL
jgi:hypothetical protein